MIHGPKIGEQPSKHSTGHEQQQAESVLCLSVAWLPSSRDALAILGAPHPKSHRNGDAAPRDSHLDAVALDTILTNDDTAQLLPRSSHQPADTGRDNARANPTRVDEDRQVNRRSWIAGYPYVPTAASDADGVRGRLRCVRGDSVELASAAFEAVMTSDDVHRQSWRQAWVDARHNFLLLEADHRSIVAGEVARDSAKESPSAGECADWEGLMRLHRSAVAQEAERVRQQVAAAEVHKKKQAEACESINSSQSTREAGNTKEVPVEPAVITPAEHATGVGNTSKPPVTEKTRSLDDPAHPVAKKEEPKGCCTVQ